MNQDCLDILPLMSDGCVDAVVTDPPYGLKFMGKHWDCDVPSVDIWLEVLRVLKPGGHLLSFFGTRTYHRGVVAIEDAGFEIRDMISWVYGSGFPKSLDVSKAIDKTVFNAAPPGFATWLRSARKAAGLTAKELCERGKFYKNVNHGGLASNWESGLGVPDTAQFNLLCDLLNLPFDKREEGRREILGWRAAIPGVAFSSEGPTELPVTAPATPEAQQWDGWGTAMKPSLEPIVVARKPLIGTVAQNVLEHGTGALNIDGCRVRFVSPDDEREAKGKNQHGDFASGPMTNQVFGKYSKDRGNYNPPGRWPANLIHDGSEEVVESFPHTSPSRKGRPRAGKNGDGWGMTATGAEYTDSGSAARFFYCAKASRSERTCGGKVENKHATVKPLVLMRYLCRLITPPGGLVMDPFCGSGSTLLAARDEGFRFLGFDREQDYCQIAKDRLTALDTGVPVKEARAGQQSLFPTDEDK